MILIVIVLAQQQHASPFIIGLVLGVGGVGTMVGALCGGLLQKRFRFTRRTCVGGIEDDVKDGS